ncbi:hypothetical protein [Salinicola corii]|nr:hypothetical protein [Salinicola corii]
MIDAAGRSVSMRIAAEHHHPELDFHEAALAPTLEAPDVSGNGLAE